MSGPVSLDVFAPVPICDARTPLTVLTDECTPTLGKPGSGHACPNRGLAVVSDLSPTTALFDWRSQIATSSFEYNVLIQRKCVGVSAHGEGAP